MAAENPGEPGPDLRDQDLASPQEVLRYLSAIMRGECPPVQGEGLVPDAPSPRAVPSTAERMKAAELLGKRYRLFSENAPAQEALPVFVDDIPHAGRGSEAPARRRTP